MALEDSRLQDQPGFLDQFQRHLDAWDGANVSFLLERLPGFGVVKAVYDDYFGSGDPRAKHQAALNYLGGCHLMAQGFIKLLAEQLRRLLELMKI
jgi:hypothetical protein